MSNTLEQERFETIEAYVLGRMSTAERERFEEERSANAVLRAEVDLQRENIRAVELGGLDRLVKQVGSEQPVELNGTRTAARWMPMLKYAAVLAILFGGAYFWFSKPTASERLYAEYHVVDPGLPVPMSSTDDPVFHDAMVAFKLGDFQEARTKWTSQLIAEPTNDTLQFYIACAELEDGQVQDAITLFQGLSDEQGSIFYAKARWYLFLAHLRMGDVNALRSMNMELDPIYGERVQEILSDKSL